MAVNVSESGGFTFNKELIKRLPEHFRLCASQDKRVLCIVESMDGTITLTKHGSRKIPKLMQDIKEAGVILPAKYIFYAENGMLFGELKVPESGTSRCKPIPKKPRGISKSQEKHILEDLHHGKLS